jgi:hypothetical protein
MYTLSPFEKNTFEATKSSWNKAMAKGATFPAEIEQLLSWVETHMSHKDGDSHAHGVFLKGDKSAKGIAEVVVTRENKKSPWVKMLRLRLNPELDERIYQNDLAAHREALDIFITAFVGVVKLSGDHAAKTVKIYGRSNEQLSFLRALTEELKKHSKKSTFAMQGRWLVITA